MHSFSQACLLLFWLTVPSGALALIQAAAVEIWSSQPRVNV